jgi:hypothetical protein
MDLMNFAVFTLISSMEYVAMILFIAALFRFRYFMKMKMHIVMVCLLLSYVSYTTRTIYDLQLGSSLIQMVLMFFFIWLLFRVQFHYAALITLAGTTGYVFIQMPILYLLLSLKVFTTTDLDALKWPTHLLPISSSTVFALISLLIFKKNWGFSFVPDSNHLYIKINKKTGIFLGLITLIFFLLIILHGIGFTIIANVYVSSFIYSVIFGVVIIYSIKREQKDA